MSEEQQKVVASDPEKIGYEHRSDEGDSHREMSDVELAYYYEDKSGSLVVDPESDKTPFLKF